jgi:hypothetical protein
MAGGKALVLGARVAGIGWLSGPAQARQDTICRKGLPS